MKEGSLIGRNADVTDFREIFEMRKLGRKKVTLIVRLRGKYKTYTRYQYKVYMFY